jgi:hypothetical protein
MLETVYALVVRPRGEAVQVGLTKRQAHVFCATFNRIMKGSGVYVEIVQVKVNLPTDDQAPEQSQ